MSTYSQAGVDIDAGDLAVQLMKEHLKKARRPEGLVWSVNFVRWECRCVRLC